MWSLPIDPTWREHVPDARLIAICLVALGGCIAWMRFAVTVVDTAGLPPLQADRALALAVCEAHGVPVAIAGHAMDAAASDPDSFFERALTIGGKSVRF